MVQIFAGADRFGEIKFIGEVPSGLACDCFCLTCGARLIARKGEINDPHFGHESGQQHPECLVGARNLVRRLISEHFQSNPLPTPSDFSIKVNVGSLCDHARWNMQIKHIEWKSRPGPESPAAILTLERGYRAELIMVTAGEDPKFFSSDPNAGLLVLHAPMPSPVSLRSRNTVIPYLLANLSLRWQHLPDAFGVLETTRQNLERQQRTVEERARAFMRQRQLAAGQRWAKIHQALTPSPQPAPAAPPPRPVALAQSAPDAMAAQDIRSGEIGESWAKRHVPLTGIFCYLLKDGSQWVLIQDSDFGHVLRQYPDAQEGWDECFPATVGRPETSAGGYLVDSIGQFFGSFGQYYKGMRNTSSPIQVSGLFKGMKP